MVHIILGTKAQLIKMAPVMVALRDLGIPYNFVSTGQHRETIDDILTNFNLPGPQSKLYEGPDIVSISQMARWAVQVLWRCIRRKDELFPGGKADILLVHGDTFSTLLGALIGKFSGLKVGHVESGLRSFHLFQPFPEELTRLLTFALSDYYFCPNEWAIKNLDRFRGIKIDTRGNTLYDALQKALSAPSPPGNVIPSAAFGVVTLHRFENFKDAKSVAKIVRCVESIAKKKRLLFVLHKITEHSLKRFGFYERLSQNPAIEMRPRYDYFTFAKILHSAEFVVSDGGSNQEECFYLGKPTLLLRNVSERQDGIGTNVLISKFDLAKVDAFIENIREFRRPSVELDHSPSAIVASKCRELSRGNRQSNSIPEAR